MNVYTSRKKANMKNGFTLCQQRQENHWPLTLQAYRTLFSKVFCECIHKLFRINTLEQASKQSK